MAVVAADFVSGREVFLVDCLRYLDLTGCRAAIIGPVARGATGLAGLFMRFHPGVARRMHAVRATADCGWHCRVTSGALGHRPGMALQADTQRVVLRMGAWVLSVRRAVAGFALQAAVPLAEAIQAETG